MIHKVAGYFKMEAVNVKTGAKRLLADWFPNLITNGGLDRMANNIDYLYFCQVGTGSTAPANANTGLVNRVGGTNNRTSNTSSVNGTAPYYRSNIIVYRFNPGAATGNLSEVGVGWATSGSLFSRALILDISSNPTTITVLSDEYLDVTYQHRFYPEESDVTGSITFTGNIGGTYNYTLRAATIAKYVGQFATGNKDTPVSMHNILNAVSQSGTYFSVYDGSIGAISSVPSGISTPIPYTGFSVGSYTGGTYTLTLTISLGIADCNLAGGGIKSIVFPWGNVHYQIEFSSKIPKTNQDILSLVFTHTWARV